MHVSKSGRYLDLRPLVRSSTYSPTHLLYLLWPKESGGDERIICVFRGAAGRALQRLETNLNQTLAMSSTPVS